MNNAKPVSILMSEKVFDVVETETGRGRTALYVGCTDWQTEFSDEKRKLISPFADTYEEFDEWIEDLKNLLDKLKPKAKRHFQKKGM